jgi:L-asparaginase
MQVMTTNSHKKIVVLGTGGTIAGRAQDGADNIGYKAGEVGVDQLLAAIPGLQGGPYRVVTEQVAQLDSKDMSFAVWQQLAVRVQALLADADVQGIVITHGTDTLEETAYFLHTLLNPAKPVVFTCAMRPASSQTPDGPQNVLDAVAVASLSGARGVVVVCAGTIHSAVDVQKTHTYRVDAFGSGDTGPVGYVEESIVRLVRNWPLAPVSYAPAAIEKIVNLSVWPRVEVLMNHAGASGAIVRALMNSNSHDTAVANDAPVMGLVIAATGNGTIHHDLEEALLSAQASGVAVVRATRCPMGRVISTPDARIPDSKGLSPVKARIALMLALATGLPA